MYDFIYDVAHVETNPEICLASMGMLLRTKGRLMGLTTDKDSTQVST